MSDDAIAKLAWLEDEARQAQKWLQKVKLSPDLLLEIIELAKAAQRPPLGYVVLKKRTEKTYSVASRIQPARASAEELRKLLTAELLATELLATDPITPGGSEFFVAEVCGAAPKTEGTEHD